MASGAQNETQKSSKCDGWDFDKRQFRVCAPDTMRTQKPI
jgi:hypothetical protein